MGKKKEGKNPVERTNKEETKTSQPETKDSGEHAKPNRMQSFYVRTVTTIAMLVGFVAILFLGHGY